MNDNKSIPSAVGSPARRRLLGALAATSGAVAFAKSLPDRWIHPVVNGVILPAHARTSPCAALSCHVRVFDDSGGVYDESVDGPATRNISLGTSSDGTFGGLDLRELAASLCEPSAGIPVTLSIAGIVDNGLTCTLGDYGGPIIEDTDGSGLAAFDDLTGGSVEAGCSWTLTFSAPGYGSCAITLNFTE